MLVTVYGGKALVLYCPEGSHNGPRPKADNGVIMVT